MPANNLNIVKQQGGYGSYSLEISGFTHAYVMQSMIALQKYIQRYYLGALDKAIECGSSWFIQPPQSDVGTLTRTAMENTR